MKKSHVHTDLSAEHVCIEAECRKQIKTRLVAIKKYPPKRCYRCFVALKLKHALKS